MGPFLAGIFSGEEEGVRRVLGETIAHTGYIIMILQVFVSRFIERFKAMPVFFSGLFILAIGFAVIGYAGISAPAIIFLGIFLFAVGEMIASPRIQEYITWIAPKEKAGLYMGTNFLAIMIGGALSGKTYTTLYGKFVAQGHPEYVWYVLGAHTIVGLILLFVFTRTLGEFKEQEQ
jgi:dipeptide/tripeptide permease